MYGLFNTRAFTVLSVIYSNKSFYCVIGFDIIQALSSKTYSCDLSTSRSHAIICTLSVKRTSYYVLERRPQMQFSMVRKFPLWRLRRYSVKYSKVGNFTFNAPCRRKLNNTSWARTNILWICSPPLYHCATLSCEIQEFS
jgi:hypothetical protein